MVEFSPKFIFIILLLTGAVLDTVADIFLKKWALENKTILLGIGLLIYFIGTVFWAFSLQHGELSRGIVIFTLLNLILVLLAGVLLFHEELSLLQKAGIVLGLVSIVLLES